MDQLIGPVTIGPIAHGGHCVARHEGRVIFVRHALPGEEVMLQITDNTSATFWRADAVSVLQPSNDRVPSRCPISGPGGCGGCDFQHVDLAAQRRLKASVVAEQLDRLAKISWDGAVEDVPAAGEQPGLGWRTRMRYLTDGSGRPGMRAHRSHQVIALPAQGCAIATERGSDVMARQWPPDTEIKVVQAAEGHAVFVGDELVDGTTTVSEQAADRQWRVQSAGFWQVHPYAAGTLVSAVLDGLKPQTAERAFDLYCGVGLFAGALVDHGCQVWGVETSRQAIADAEHNLGSAGRQARFQVGRVDRRLRGMPRQADLIVLDPPRTGAGRAVMKDIIARRPRAIAYVACDPAALARDLATAAELGYRHSSIRAFDLFPMTHQVECVAILVRQ